MFRIPQVTKYLLIINVVAYFVMEILSGGGMVNLNRVLGLHFFLAPDFELYQLFTYMFMHGGFTHLFFNMFALWMFGCVVENVLGPRRFLLYYIICGVGAGLFQELAQLVEFVIICNEQIPGFEISNLLTVAHNSAPTINAWTTVGASGAVYAILLAFGLLFPEQRIFIFPLPVPIKAKWFVCIYVAIELFSAMSTTSDGIAHIAHLGGMVFGWFLFRYWRKHPYGSGYSHSRGGFFDKMRSGWERKQADFTTTSTQPKTDWDYNAEKKDKQNEIDAILDKIRKSGYDSLSKEEKQQLFDNSRN